MPYLDEEGVRMTVRPEQGDALGAGLGRQRRDALPH